MLHWFFSGEKKTPKSKLAAYLSTEGSATVGNQIFLTNFAMFLIAEWQYKSIETDAEDVKFAQSLILDIAYQARTTIDIKTRYWKANILTLTGLKDIDYELGVEL